MKYKTSVFYDNMVNSVGGMNQMGKVIRSTEKNKESGVIIDCGLGESSQFSLQESILKILSNANAINSYVTPTQGLKCLRDGIASALTEEFKKPISINNLMITPGSELALDLVYKSLLNPGDEIIIFDPFFIPFVSFAKSYLARPIIVDTYKSFFLPDLKLLNKIINRKTKMIVINSPNNPTGRIYPMELVGDLVNLARKSKIFILSDEAYKHFDYDNVFFSPYNIYPEGTIVLRTFSKEYSMMGFKVGYLLANKDFVNKVGKIQYPGWGAPMISSLLAAEVLKKGTDSERLTEYKKIRNYLYSHLKRFGVLDYKPEGAFYFYVRSPNNNAIEFATKLAKKGLLVVPAFSKRNSHIRLSYGKLNLSQAKKVIKIIEREI